jgi:hypothetical protein
MKRAILVFFGLLGLSGCATVDRMDEGLNALLGQDAETAVQILDKPTEKRTSANYTVYFWIVDRTETYTRPLPKAVDSRTSQHNVNYYNEVVAVDYGCDIQLFADRTGRLIKWERDGNTRGCQDYIRIRSKYAEARKGK